MRPDPSSMRRKLFRRDRAYTHVAAVRFSREPQSLFTQRKAETPSLAPLRPNGLRETRRRDTKGGDDPHCRAKPFPAVEAWRILHPVRTTKAPRAATPTNRKEARMKISARNQLKGTVSAVKDGAVNGIVLINLGEAAITADITMASIKELGLAEGKDAIAIIKASNVMFAAGSEPVKGISARNQLVGTVSTIKKGAVNGHVALELADGNIVTGSITNAAIDDLGLEVGAPAIAIVKSTDVIVGVE